MANVYRTLWRWHFYAGLFVIPFILILSVTGALYLFKPQIDAAEERSFAAPPATVTVSPEAQRDAALAAFPGARFHSYRLPRAAGDPAMIHLALPGSEAMRDVFVAADGRVLGSLDPEMRLTTLLSHLHGSLLAGFWGSVLVELAASWAIVMVLSGLYLWWPRGRGAAGVVWPRLSGGARLFWRDLHAVTGFWVAGLALVLLLTGLPWTHIWGEGFKQLRAMTTATAPDWKLGLHDAHDHQAMLDSASVTGPVRLNALVARAVAERLPFPASVVAPGARSPGVWTIRADPQNRPLARSITIDAQTGRTLARKTFADKPLADRIIGYGIAWHEGQLLGAFNQAVGVLTAVALVTLSVSGFILWRRRKPAQALGAPPAPALPPRIGGVVAIIGMLALLLPMLAVSLLLLWLFDRLVLPRLPGLAAWLGVAPAARLGQS
ncbi:PepSY domain-containing protein [Sphingomonas sp.]|uniref:PepSY-associated TM helix domain-containing protein n=1 Tax=Sphingomonas sp. TaxID=28214 RepID=UPI001D803FFE|nr:PepSY domain-containing protein [Sphingomonas sp.]MBX9795411.1 PepSY domain-containing protein [Sphingomonas sp.]